MLGMAGWLMRFLFFVTFFVSIYQPGFALEKSVDGPVVKVFKERYLPKALAKIVVGVSTKENVISALGNPGKTEDKQSLLFYDLAGHRYDTTIEIKNGKVKSIYFAVPLGTLQLKDIEAYISPEQIKKFKSSDASKNEHDQGRDGEVRIDKENLLLVVKKGKNQSVKAYYQSL